MFGCGLKADANALAKSLNNTEIKTLVSDQDLSLKNGPLDKKSIVEYYTDLSTSIEATDVNDYEESEALQKFIGTIVSKFLKK